MIQLKAQAQQQASLQYAHWGPTDHRSPPAGWRRAHVVRQSPTLAVFHLWRGNAERPDRKWSSARPQNRVKTLTASATTSGPIPSPPTTASLIGAALPASGRCPHLIASLCIVAGLSHMRRSPHRFALHRRRAVSRKINHPSLLAPTASAIADRHISGHVLVEPQQNGRTRTRGVLGQLRGLDIHPCGTQQRCRSCPALRAGRRS